MTGSEVELNRSSDACEAVVASAQAGARFARCRSLVAIGQRPTPTRACSTKSLERRPPSEANPFLTHREKRMHLHVCGPRRQCAAMSTSLIGDCAILVHSGLLVHRKGHLERACPSHAARLPKWCVVEVL